MSKCFVILAVLCAVVYARPHKWQMLKPVPGYIPVYIQHGDTPLEEINLELAEAFHAIPSGRSALHDVAAEDKESNIAEESIDESMHPKELEHEKREEMEVDVESAADNLLPQDGSENKRAHEKKPKKVTSVHIQKIPPGSEDI